MAPIMPIIQKERSRLLDLPAELRNFIFELVAEDIDEAFVAINSHGKPRFSDVQHPLSQTCRQLREEFGSIAVKAAVRCWRINTYSKNFEMPPKAPIENLLRSLPKISHRSYIQHIVVHDVDFDINLTNKMKNIITEVSGHEDANEGEDACGRRRTNCHTFVHFDINVLSVDSLKRALANLDNERYRRSLNVSEHVVGFALQQAVNRYPKQQWTRTQGRKKGKGGRGSGRKTQW